MTYRTHPITASGATVARIGQTCRQRLHRDAAADRVLALVAAHAGIPRALLLHSSRCQAPIARSRQMAMYLMHTLLGRTMTEVGRYFGRDRTTVAHACGRIEDARDDRTFDAELTALETCLSTGELESDVHVRH